jgi:hypothetical protein
MESDIPSRLISGAFIYPPMDIFENPPIPPEEQVKSLLAKCERLAGDKKKEFYAWLGAMSSTVGQFASIVFFGRSVYGGADAKPTDIDVLLHLPETNVIASYGFAPVDLPGFIHMQTVNELKYALNPESWEFYVANRMIVYPQMASDSLFESVQGARKRISGSGFFAGGVGELITHAAYKALTKAEQGYFLNHEWEAVRDKSLAVDLRFLDTGSMESRTVHPKELNERVRSRMKPMEDKEVDALTNAAMRRLAVRKSKRAELGARFLHELRAMR